MCGQVAQWIKDSPFTKAARVRFLIGHEKGAFLVPYLLFLVFGAAPVLILEIGLGQFMSKSGTGAWNICPLFQGIGVANLVMMVLVNVYYIVVLAWGCYYFVMSFQTVLPWSHCDNPWNTPRCSLTKHIPCDVTNGTFNNTLNMSLVACVRDNTTSTVDPSVEFWERKVLQMSDGIEESGGIIRDMALCLLFVWVFVYFCVWKGIKWTGKVVYFTATFPYVVLITLLIRGLTLDGALYGIKYFLIPDFSKLAEAQVWVDGGTQIFFSLAIALGAMITLGSYKKFDNNFYRDCFFIMCINSGTSLLGGFTVFSILGFMATEQGVDISEVVSSGAGLAFITYPKAVLSMPFSHLWSALFFFMLFLVGIDSQFVHVEAVITPILDMFPKHLNKPWHRMAVTAVYCVGAFLIGLSMTTKGGIYIFTLFDYYSASGMVMLWVCFWECIAIGWIFGAHRFYDVLELMLGYRINMFLWICLKFVTPAVTAGIFIFQVSTFKSAKVGNYEYPPLGEAFGLLMAMASMICIPITMVIKLRQLPGTLLERLRASVIPILKKKQIPKAWKSEGLCRSVIIAEDEEEETEELFDLEKSTALL
ncbi:sodium- and chloride-dependent taurine transporter-like isoform X2 [Mizuhopecten yessoensis]|uniref:sodium- and chloride-dependent taurine transporter-like isoform X2 n=1 Tax=Mizuhopecten yessoensis TaxID=6573 RepID=UPI000B459187|nr:sodium- and chloride-dependent taurine transporter-like isoform X2 [Mizuhopecten yessoensis]